MAEQLTFDTLKKAVANDEVDTVLTYFVAVPGERHTKGSQLTNVKHTIEVTASIGNRPTLSPLFG